LSTAAASDQIPAVSTPSNFFTDTDYTNMSGTLLYDITNTTIDNFGLERNAGWLILAILIAVILSVIVASMTGKLALGIVTAMIIMCIGWLQGLVPLWIPLASLLLTFGVVGHQMRNQGG
jgi:CHASE2 domain-containing sensor protein